jgi:4-amino-4-deoxy-L-arabinose transferase-like glycosyltransferase
MTQPPAMAAPPSMPRRRLGWVLFGGVLLYYVLSALANINRQTDIDKLDTGRYLNAALSIQENGGVWTFPLQCLRFEYREDVQQPLYHLLLAPFAARELGFFVRAKFLTLLTGIAALVALFVVARRGEERGEPSADNGERMEVAALLACFTLALSPDFVDHSTFPACEPLFMVWLVLAWGYGLRWMRGEGGGWAAGAFAGLAYLTKGSGLFLLPLFVLGALWKRYQLKRPARLWGFLAAFVIVASPLILRNALGYGSPLHDPYSACLWLDRWEDWYAVSSGALPRPTLWSYLQSHTAGEVAARLFAGVCGVIGTLAGKTLALGSVSVIGKVLGGAVLALAAVGIATDGDRLRRGWTALTLAVFLLPAVWFFPVVPGSRFLLIVAPILVFYAAATATRLAGSALARLRRAPEGVVATALGVLCAALIVARLASPDLWRNPAESMRLDAGFVELRAWLEARLPEGGAYAHGPSHRYGFSWNSARRIRALDLPPLRDGVELTGWMRDQKLRYLVLDRDVLQRRGRLFGVAEFQAGGTTALRIPAGWRIAGRVNGPGGAIVLAAPD